MSFILRNFAAPAAFVVAFKLLGAKPAILIAVVTALAQLVEHKLSRVRIGPFYYMATGFTILFGTMDLFVESPRFFRLEPFMQNLIVGLIFLGSLLLNRPILSWFAESLPEKYRPASGEIDASYLRNVTIAWTTYLLVKAAFFFWVAFRVDLAQLMVLRTFAGGGSLWLMLLGEVAYRKLVRKRAVQPARTPAS